MTETYKSKDQTYLIRNIPKDLWSKVKHRAVDEGVSAKEIIIRALKFYLHNR